MTTAQLVGQPVKMWIAGSLAPDAPRFELVDTTGRRATLEEVQRAAAGSPVFVYPARRGGLVAVVARRLEAGALPSPIDARPRQHGGTTHVLIER